MECLTFSSNPSTASNGSHTSGSRFSDPPVPSRVFKYPHRPAPPLPEDKPPNAREMNRSHSLPVAPSTENVYLEAIEIRHSTVVEEGISSDQVEGRKSRPVPSEDQSFAWMDIFYRNEADDQSSVLNKIGQIGAFLVRPQLKKSKSHDHEYTLSIYAFGGIIKYKIFSSTDGQFSLASDDNEPHFHTIPDLCKYYTSHPLPRSPLRDDPIKGPVGNLCLKWPYTYYPQRSDRF